ncbi:hypothetical protein BIW11_02571 [Tropilaelaps mercedesae]|uniref:Uncharacterized protein n=1 Tax=Tropilaelaps mercedesae TaxID=418985 RepID=A0A1V9Y0X0_9ACAR|nr:hypothetical protein BIW11_02571 [Tropilaelaps mercedesae]
MLREVFEQEQEARVATYRQMPDPVVLKKHVFCLTRASLSTGRKEWQREKFAYLTNSLHRD